MTLAQMGGETGKLVLLNQTKGEEGMTDRKAIIDNLNHLLGLLEVGFQIENLIRDANGASLLLAYEREEKRKYKLTCKKGLALNRVFPKF